MALLPAKEQHGLGTVGSSILGTMWSQPHHLGVQTGTRAGTAQPPPGCSPMNNLLQAWAE